MSASRITIAIFTGFLIIQGMSTSIGMGWIPGFSHSKNTPCIPGRIIKNNRIAPPRCVVPCTCQHVPTERIPLPPVVAWVFGMKMNWQKVTVETLRWIPGISRRMAARLIRIRDVYAVKSPAQLQSFPHVGKKTVQRLKEACFFPYAN